MRTIFLVAKNKKVIASTTNKKKAYTLIEQELGEFTSPSYSTFSKRITMFGSAEVGEYAVRSIDLQ